MPHTLPALPYDFAALEPHIDSQTMQIHHGKHHQAYVTNLNAALDKHPDLHNKSLDDLMRGLNGVPEDIRTAVRNNGGGHWNHSMFWKLMAPNAGGPPTGAVADVAIHTSHARVWGELIRRELRLHWPMTRLTAEGDRLADLIAFVAANGGAEEEDDAPDDKKPEFLAVHWAGQVHGDETGGHLANLPSVTALPPNTGERHAHAEKKKSRCDHIRENAEIRIAGASEEIDGEQQQERKEAAQGDYTARKAQPVAPRAGTRIGFVFCFHRSLKDAGRSKQSTPLCAAPVLTVVFISSGTCACR